MIALLCPGQGSQKPGFLTPWLDDAEITQRLRELGDAAGLDLIHYGTAADEETIKDTAIAQPLIVAAGLVVGERMVQRLSSEQLLFAGHSVGEITASALAGVLTPEEAMQFIRVRAEGMAAAAAQEPTAMAAVLGGVEDEVREAIEKAGLTAANSNGGGQIVAAGSQEAVAAFTETPPARSRVIPLKVAGAFHTAYMRPAVASLQELADGLTPQEPSGTLLSNRDGRAVTSGAAALQSLVDQVTRPVRWDHCMSTMADLGVERLCELPPAGTLTGLAKRALKGVPASAISTLEDLESLQD